MKVLANCNDANQRLNTIAANSETASQFLT
jgi:hypothetical protein